MHTDTATRTRRRLLAIAAFALVLAAGCGDDTDATPSDYFAAFDESQTELDAEVESLFETPVALMVEEFVNDAPEALDADEDALAHQFVTEFWTGATDALESHRDAIAGLDVPDALRSKHDAYREALDGAIDARDTYLTDAAGSSGAELLATFWELPPEFDAMTSSCRAIVEEAATVGIAISNPICTE